MPVSMEYNVYYICIYLTFFSDCPDALKYAIAKETLKQMKEAGYEKFRYEDEEKDWVKQGNEFRTC